jgi:glycosyltransferase involved in cell wall biosynthesis
MKAEWVRLARRLGLEDRTEFLGSVDWEKMPALYQRADAFIFTSLSDSFGSQVIEAMAQSLPILTLDHQGVGDFVPLSAGIKVPVTSPEETVAALAAAIHCLISSPDLCRKMGEAAWECAQEHTWDKRAQWMSRFYEDVVRVRRSLHTCLLRPTPFEKGRPYHQGFEKEQHGI